jgi:hypothetical protein
VILDMVVDKIGDNWGGYWCADDESIAMVIERDGERWSVSVYKYLAQYAYITDHAAISIRDGTLSVSLDMPDQGRAYTLRWDVLGERLVSAYDTKLS